MILRKRPPQVLLDVHHRPQPPDLSGSSGEGDRNPRASMFGASLPSSPSRCKENGPPGDVRLPGRRGPSIVGLGLDPAPHDDRIFVGVAVVMLTPPDRGESGAVVKVKGHVVARAH